VAFEALLRWEDEELGKVSPAEFVPIAEEAGLIVPVGLWLLREACFQARLWQPQEAGPVGVSVNVSTLQFRQAGLRRAGRGGAARQPARPRAGSRWR
jgi:EAL domain-containing protein (putative c-di-GMP-specific phosphodiesterase class I)